MHKPVPERREESSEPPTALMQSYLDMDSGSKKHLRILGFGMIVFGIALPMIGGLFIDLGGAYWIFSGVVFVVGFMCIWPQMGIYLVEKLPTGLAKILPSKLFGRVERRAPRAPLDDLPLGEDGEVDER